MNILIACEESQAVCKAFRAKGHTAYSCDLQKCSGGHPEWHICGSVLSILNGHCIFGTEDGKTHTIKGKWDMIISHPPCTYLTVTGNRWFNVERYGEKAKARLEDREDAVDFFMQIASADCDKIVIENPVGIMSTRWKKPTQVIHPWQYWAEEWEKTEKQTCLWIKGLPALIPVHEEKPELSYHEWITPDGKHKRQTMWYYQTRCLPHKDRAKAASKTFPGIAKAMAEQWG